MNPLYEGGCRMKCLMVPGKSYFSWLNLIGLEKTVGKNGVEFTRADMALFDAVHPEHNAP